MEKFKAKVIQKELEWYVLASDKNIIYAKPRGNVKKSTKIIVGDTVEVEKKGEDYVIIDVLPRKNYIIRPNVCNIDQMVIVVSVGAPKPDFLLLDKQLIFCIYNNITPIICINKIDLQDNDMKVKEDILYIKNTYEKLGIKLVFCSAKNNIAIDTLKCALINKTSAFSGNSGVGKSSIIDILVTDEKLKVGEIGEKSKRGKHTTKSVKIYAVEDNIYILDTPGFSSYELYDIDYRKLKECYPEFKNIHCDYSDCNHYIEGIDVCQVKKAVDDNIIDRGRYERYVYILNEQKEKFDKKYR